jgi:micrococcal nuclease
MTLTPTAKVSIAVAIVLMVISAVINARTPTAAAPATPLPWDERGANNRFPPYDQHNHAGDANQKRTGSRPAPERGFQPSSSWPVVHGFVTRVQDGDSFVMSQDGVQTTIRMAYIDAPENAQTHGRASAESLMSQLKGQRVTVYIVDRDVHGRFVGVVTVASAGGERDINLHQLQTGNAWYYRYFATSQPPNMVYQYETAEAAANQNRLGLWREQNPTNPRDFRVARRRP